MAKVDQDLIDDLRSRGLVAQTTGEGAFAEHLAEQRVLYCGFDPTADSLHIGSLVPLLALRRFQLAGHKPVALVGGATGLIGDPSFKAQERQLNTPDIVEGWTERLRQQVSRFVDLDSGSCSAEVANNLDWMGNMPVLDFLRDVGKHFAVNAMIHKESVKTRIEREGEGISYTEFSYMLLQSYDFAELYRRFGCTLQIGGSDQWGNITGGIDLVRRMHRVPAFGLTLPLITKSDGTKFGKTESGTIWLDPAKTSPYAFYQFWVNVADQDVYRFLHYFTFLPISELIEIERADELAQGKKSAQAILAREVTRIVHGEEGVEAAERISDALFSGSLDKLTDNDMEQLALDGMPSSDMKVVELSLIDALVDSGLALTPRGEVTQGQARKFIRDGAVRVNGEQQREDSFTLSRSSAYFGRFHLLRRGKKHFHLLRWL